MLEEVLAAHDRRLPGLDPLLPTPNPLPDLAPGEELLTVDGGVAVARRIRPDPDSLAATWGTADQHRLLPRVGGDGPVTAMAALLDGWAGVLAGAATDDPDSSAGLTWPSRDFVMTRLFVERGLVPERVLAIRPAARPVPDGTGAVRVRPITPDDLDDVVELFLTEVRWDAQFGRLTVRPSTAGAVRREYRVAVSRDEPWAWVAEDAGRVTGLVTVTPPEYAGWIASATSAAVTAYVGCTVVAPGHRGAGVGAALVRHAHNALDRAGVDATLLHYSALNPLSGPFWHRCGYRPLWTSWDVAPASRLGAGSAR